MMAEYAIAFHINSQLPTKAYPYEYFSIYIRHATGTKYGETQTEFPIMTEVFKRFNVLRSGLQVFRSPA